LTIPISKTSTWEIELNANPLARYAVDVAFVFNCRRINFSVAKYLHSLVDVNIFKQDHGLAAKTSNKRHKIIHWQNYQVLNVYLFTTNHGNAKQEDIALINK